MRARLGVTLGAPALLLTLIHRSAWKGNSPKFLCSILYRVTRVQPITLLGLVLQTESAYDILGDV